MGKVGPSHLYSRHLSSLKNILTQCLGSILEGSTRENGRRSGNFNTGSFGPRDHTDMTPRLRPQRGRGGTPKTEAASRASIIPPSRLVSHLYAILSITGFRRSVGPLPCSHPDPENLAGNWSPSPELSAFHSQINQSRVSSTKIGPLTASDVC